jgi:spermidine/putrescine transport system permease protein
MQSFENYNTTLFAIGFNQTLPIYIGTKLRVFISPAMNALAVVFIVLTITGAVLYQTRRLREAASPKTLAKKSHEARNIDHHRRMPRRRASAGVNA